MGLLSPYRVLDLTDERGQIAGFMLGDLGADVISIEPPDGNRARRVGPLMPNPSPGPVSLSFAAYNQNKRSAVLDLSEAQDRSRFLELVQGADFLLDSGPPSLLDSSGLGVDALAAVNPQLVHVRVTPFGTDGPMANAPASDLTIASLGGPVALQGHPDRAPLRLSVPQVWRHAGGEAAVAALIGHARMRTTGEGVFIDVSAQSAMVWTTLQGAEASAIQGWDYERAGSELQLGAVGVDLAHPCKDGHVIALAIGRMFQQLEPWLIEEGHVGPEFGEREDWGDYDKRLFGGAHLAVSREEITDVFRRFFVKKTKAELFERGRELGATIAPVQTVEDLLGFEQLHERDYFNDLELADGRRVRSPGAFVRSTAFTPSPRRGAPGLGEHTAEILHELDTAPRNRVPAEPAAAPDSLPLAGLKVADFSWVGVGPISGKALADHGADVIRIESQGRPDVLRAAGPYKDGEPGWNRSHFYGEFNTSKRSLALALKHERAGEVVPAILEWADVILESFTPGAAARLGVGYDAARAINPGVIMVSTCLMGQTGSLASLAGYGYHAAALAGFTALTGDPDRAPVGPWNAYTDTVAPRFLTTALLAALDHRRRTSEGQYLDLAQMEAALHFLAPELLAGQAADGQAGRMGNRAADAAPHGVYPCAGADEWCAIAVDDAQQWAALQQVLGEPDWAMEESLQHVEHRIAQHDRIDEGIAQWTRQRSPRDAMAALLAGGVPAGHVQRSSDLLRDPQLSHRGFHHTLDHDEMGPVPYAGHQFRISGYDHGPRTAAPVIGGHSFEFLTDDLGFDPGTVADWLADGLLE